MTLALLSFSSRGEALGQKIKKALMDEGDFVTVTRCGSGELLEWTQQHFYETDALVFIGSCGIAVRAIAPFIQNKTVDPAVIVIDDMGTFSISLLSGHLGEANKLSTKLADSLGAVPVITTATDLHGVFAVDSWAKEQGMQLIRPERIKEISSLLLEGKKVSFRCDVPMKGPLPENVYLSEKEEDFVISYKREESDILQLIPPVISLGVGCRRGTSHETIERAFQSLLEKTDLHERAVYQVASIDLKKDEAGLLAFCQARHLPVTFYSAQELQEVHAEISSSAFVESVTGVDNVCERSALLGAGEGAELIHKKEVLDGVTMALARRPFTVRFEEKI